MTVAPEHIFDPFNDRKARLVRNGLSTAFVSALQRMDFSIVEERSRQLARQYDTPLYCGYLKEKMKHYHQVFTSCMKEKAESCDVFFLTGMLWKHHLFFEVHELLEQEWGQAKGPYRKALQGLIQAAGYYLLLEAGKRAGAGKLADKAVVNLTDNRRRLPDNLRIEVLIDRLRRKDEKPPLLFS